MEKHGLVLRLAIIPLDAMLVTAMASENEEQFMKRIKEAKLAPTSKFYTIDRTCEGRNTKFVLLTDKGIELRNSLVKRARLSD
jgi:hypothetical protein